MANGAKMALAVGAGYFLGRTRKMRIALMLAGAGLTGKFPPRPGELVSQGLQSLGASGQLQDLTTQLRGEVLTAAKAAAMAAATQRVDALSDRLQGVVPVDEVGRTAGSAAEGVGRTAGSATQGLTSATGLTKGRRRKIVDDEPDYDEEPLDVEEEDVDDEEDFQDEDFDEDDVEDQDELDDQDLDQDEDFDDEEPQDEAPAPRRAARRATSPRASTRRVRKAPSDSDAEVPSGPSRRGRTAAKRAPVRRGR